MSQLEAALAALADFSGPEVDAYVSKLKPLLPPMDVHLTQCQQLIDQTVRHIEDPDRSRAVESFRLWEARLRVSVPPPAVASDVSPEQLVKFKGSAAGHGRLWPNRLWPNRLWPILVFFFSVLAKFCEPKKPKPQRPQNLHSDLNPKPCRPKP